MGRRCAWCETVLPSHGGAWSPASDAICRGCYEDLEQALARSGLRIGAQDGAITSLAVGADAPAIPAARAL